MGKNFEDRLPNLYAIRSDDDGRIGVSSSAATMLLGVVALLAVAFGAQLQAAGVPTAVLRAEGTIHDWMMLNALAEDATTKATIELAALTLKNALA